MKERIEKKLEEYVEKLLNKEELDVNDITFLNIMLTKMETQEKDEMYEEKNKELAEMISKTLIK